MLEAVVAEVLNRFVGTYVHNIQTEQLKVAVWSGNVNLSNLEVRPDALRHLDLPITVVKGVVSNLTLTVPWANLKSKPIVLVLDGIHILARPTKDAQDAAEESARRTAAKQQRVRDMERFLSESASASSASKTDTLDTPLVGKLVENIQVIFTNIHIRMEDSTSVARHDVALGFTVQRLSAESANEQWVPVFSSASDGIVRKLASLEHLSAYVGYGMPQVDVTQSNAAFVAEMQRLVKDLDDGYERLIQPVNGSAKMTFHRTCRDANVPRRMFELAFEHVSLNIGDDHISTFESMAVAFRLFQRRQIFRHNRPKNPIKGHASEWWRFLRECIVGRIHQRELQWTWQSLKKHGKARREYMTLYRTYKEAKDAPAKAAAKSKCEAAEESLTFESIRNFRYVVDKRMAAELAATQAAIAASPSTGALQSPSKAAVAAGWVSSLRAWGRGAPTAAMTLNKEDVDRLYDLLDDQTSADDSSLPEDDKFESLRISFKLGLFSLQLAGSGGDPLATLVAESFMLEMKQFPNTGGVRVSGALQRILLLDPLPTHRSSFTKEIVRGESAKDSNLLQFVFASKPTDVDADVQVDLTLRAVQIVYDHRFMAAIGRFVERRSRSFRSNLQALTLDKLDDIRKQTTARIQLAISERLPVRVYISVEPSVLFIMSDSFDEAASAIELRLGHIMLCSTATTNIAENVAAVVGPDAACFAGSLDKTTCRFVTTADISKSSPDEAAFKLLSTEPSAVRLWFPADTDSAPESVPHLYSEVDFGDMAVNLSRQHLGILLHVLDVAFPDADQVRPAIDSANDYDLDVSVLDDLSSSEGFVDGEAADATAVSEVHPESASSLQLRNQDRPSLILVCLLQRLELHFYRDAVADPFVTLILTSGLARARMAPLGWTVRVSTGRVRATDWTQSDPRFQLLLDGHGGDALFAPSDAGEAVVLTLTKTKTVGDAPDSFAVDLSVSVVAAVANRETLANLLHIFDQSSGTASAATSPSKRTPSSLMRSSLLQSFRSPEEPGSTVTVAVSAKRAHITLNNANIALASMELEQVSFEFVSRELPVGVTTMTLALGGARLRDLRSAEEDGQLALWSSPAESVIHLVLTQYDKAAADKPSHDIHLEARISSVHVLYCHRFFLPFVDFAMDFLNVITLVNNKQTSQDTEDFLEHEQPSIIFYDVSLSSPVINVPLSASDKSAMFVFQVGDVAATSRLLPSGEVGPVAIKVDHVCLFVQRGQRDPHRTAILDEHDWVAEGDSTLDESRRRHYTLDASTASLRLRLSNATYVLFNNVLRHNIGGSYPAELTTAAVGKGSALEEAVATYRVKVSTERISTFTIRAKTESTEIVLEDVEGGQTALARFPAVSARYFMEGQTTNWQLQLPSFILTSPDNQTLAISDVGHAPSQLTQGAEDEAFVRVELNNVGGNGDTLPSTAGKVDMSALRVFMDGAALTRVWAVFATDSDDDDDEDGAALLTAKEHSPQSRIEYKFNIGTVRMDIPHSPASLWAHDARACLRWSSDGSSSATFDIVSMLLFAGDFAAPPVISVVGSEKLLSIRYVDRSASPSAAAPEWARGFDERAVNCRWTSAATVFMGALQCNVRDNTVAAVVAALGTFGKDDAAPAGSSPLSALSPTPTLLYHIAISNPSIRLHDADAAERRHMALWLGSFLAQNSISVEADQVTERIELSLEHTAAQIHNPDQQAVPEVLFAETQIDMNVKRVSARKGVLLSTEVGVLVHDIAIVVSPDHLAYLKRLPVLLDGILQAPTPPPTSARRASLAPVTPARRSRVHAATTAMQPASFAVSALFGNLTASLLYADGEKLCDVVLETPEVTYKDDSLKGLHFGCNAKSLVIQDNRDGAAQRLTRLIGPCEDAEQEAAHLFMLTYTRRKTGAVNVQLSLDRPRITILTPFIQALYDFAMPLMALSDDLPAHSSSTNLTGSYLSSFDPTTPIRVPTLSVAVSISRPELVLVGSHDDLHTPAIVHSFGLAGNFDRTSEGEKFAGSMQDLQIYSCRLGRVEATRLFMVDPFSMSVDVLLGVSGMESAAPTSYGSVDVTQVLCRVTMLDLALIQSITTYLYPVGSPLLKPTDKQLDLADIEVPLGALSRRPSDDDMTDTQSTRSSVTAGAQPSRVSFTVNASRIDLLLLDDVAGHIVPLMMLRLAPFEAEIVSSAVARSATLSQTLSVQYFNIYRSAWETCLEPWPMYLQLRQKHLDRPAPEWNVSLTGQNTQADVTVSRTLIDMLSSIKWSSNSLDYGVFDRRETFPFVLSNATGAPISFARAGDSSSVVVEPGESHHFRFAQDFLQTFVRDQLSTHKRGMDDRRTIRVSLTDRVAPTGPISVTRMGVYGYPLTHATGAKEILIVTIALNAQRCTEITLESQYAIVNCSDKPAEVQLDGVTLGQVDVNARLPIPINALHPELACRLRPVMGRDHVVKWSNALVVGSLKGQRQTILSSTSDQQPKFMYRYSMQLERRYTTDGRHSYYDIRARQTIWLANSTPCDFDFKLIVASESRLASGLLRGQQSMAVAGMLGTSQAVCELEVRLRCPGRFEWSSRAIVAPVSRRQAYIPVALNKKYQLNLELQYDDDTPDYELRIRVVAPYAILNLSGHPLQFYTSAIPNEHFSLDSALRVWEPASAPASHLDTVLQTMEKGVEVVLAQFPEANRRDVMYDIRVTKSIETTLVHAAEKKLSRCPLSPLEDELFPGVYLFSIPPTVTTKDARLSFWTRNVIRPQSVSLFSASAGVVSLQAGNPVREQLDFAVELRRGTALLDQTMFLTIRPFFVIINQTGSDLQFSLSSNDYIATVNKGQRWMFYWPAGMLPRWTDEGDESDEKRLLTAREPSSEIDVPWSQPFRIFTPDTQHVRLLAYLPEQRDIGLKFISIMTYLENGALVSTVQDCPPPFVIYNKSQHVVAVRQKGSSAFYTVASGDHLEYSWDSTQQTKLLQICPMSGNSLDSARRNSRTYDIRKLGLKVGLLLPRVEGDLEFVDLISVYVAAQGASRVVVLSDSSNKQTAEQTDEDWEVTSSVVGRASIWLPAMLISVVDQEPWELALISLEKVRLAVIRTSRYAHVDAAIQELQVDNQLPGTPFRELVRRAVVGKKQQASSSSGSSGQLVRQRNESDTPFMSLELVVSADGSRTRVRLLPRCHLALCDMNIRIDEVSVLRWLHFLSPWVSIAGREEANPLHVAFSTTRLHVREQLYIGVLAASPLRITFSFARSKQAMLIFSPSFGETVSEWEQGPGRFLRKGLGVLVTNVDEAPFKFAPIGLQHTVLSVELLKQMLVTNYEEQLRSQAFRVIFSVDALGSPSTMFRSVRRGVDEFISGSSRGDISHGTAGLLKHSAYGFLNLSSNISNAVGQGLSQLSFDKDFAANRAQRKADQPKSASAGFAQGSKGLAVGVLEGLSGTVEQPMLGFKKSGFKGLAEGLGRGLVGLVTKPSAGFFDLVSSVSAGVGSHVKEREKDRRRFPRQITGDGILRTYNQNEALASLVVASCARAVLQRTARGGRRDAAQRDHYVGHVVSMDIQAGHPLLCIVTQHVFLLVNPALFAESAEPASYVLVEAQLEGMTVKIKRSVSLVALASGAQRVVLRFKDFDADLAALLALLNNPPVSEVTD